MEGLGSSTSAVRNKRGDWLSNNTTGMIIKVALCLAVAALLSVAVILVVPIVKRSGHKSATALASTHHNFVTNSTFGNQREFVSIFNSPCRSIGHG